MHSFLFLSYFFLISFLFLSCSFCVFFLCSLFCAFLCVFCACVQCAPFCLQSSKGNDDYVELTEFRTLLLYLRQYLELYVMFDEIDTDDDKRIEEKEFGRAVALIERWGVKVADAGVLFREIDADGGGKVLFDEFAHWAIKNKLDLDDDDEVETAGEGSGLIAKPAKKKRTKTKVASGSKAKPVANSDGDDGGGGDSDGDSSDGSGDSSGSGSVSFDSDSKGDGGVSVPNAKPVSNSSGGGGGGGGDESGASSRGGSSKGPAGGKVDWKKLADKLPYGKDADSKQKRKAMFRRLDPNGNGFLSLSEVDKGIVDIGLSTVIAKPVIIRAFNASKGDNTVCILSCFFLALSCFLSVFSFSCVFVRILRSCLLRSFLPAVEQRE